MKKVILILLILLMSVSCAYKEINIITVKLNDKLYERISKDTISLLKEYIKPNEANIIVFSKNNDFLNYIEQHLRIAGYSILITPSVIDMKKNDYEFGYILDLVNTEKKRKDTIKTTRYTFKLNNMSCSKIYEINNDKEILSTSNWVCFSESKLNMDGK